MKTVTFLTGASSGIGMALAPLLAREGHAVALAARRLAPMNELSTRVRKDGGQALPIRCDVTDRASVQRAVRDCERRLGPVERLIANAGVGENMAPEAFDGRTVARIFETNVLGPAYCIEAVLPGMLARRSGQIVGISSLAGYRGLPRAAAYGASKAALSTLLEGLRMDVAPHGIAVTVICPGFVKSPLTARNRYKMPFLLETDDAARRIHRAIVRRRRLYAFPWPLATLARIGRLLPAALYEGMVAGRAMGGKAQEIRVPRRR